MEQVKLLVHLGLNRIDATNCKRAATRYGYSLPKGYFSEVQQRTAPLFQS